MLTYPQNERKFNSRLYDLKDRLEQCHSTNRSMQNYVQFLKNSYSNVFGESSAVPGSSSGFPGPPSPVTPYPWCIFNRAPLLIQWWRRRCILNKNKSSNGFWSRVSFNGRRKMQFWRTGTMRLRVMEGRFKISIMPCLWYSWIYSSLSNKFIGCELFVGWGNELWSWPYSWFECLKRFLTSTITLNASFRK